MVMCAIIAYITISREYIDEILTQNIYSKFVLELQALQREAGIQYVDCIC